VLPRGEAEASAVVWRRLAADNKWQSMSRNYIYLIQR